MTEEEIRADIVELSILNDLIETRLTRLGKVNLKHKNLQKSIIRSHKASLSLATVMDNKLGVKRADAFYDMYAEADKIFKEISSNFK